MPRTSPLVLWKPFPTALAVLIAAGVSAGAGEGRRVRAPFDPVRDNGPLFVGWPAPKLALVITGRQAGYLEPCGCAGLDRMRGGLPRRATLIEALQAKGWPLVRLDTGGLSGRFSPQGWLKLRVAVSALQRMGYDAIGWGTSDLRYPAADLVGLSGGEEQPPARFVSANVGLFGLAAHVTPPVRRLEMGGVKLGITAVVGQHAARELNNPDVELIAPEAALTPLVPALQRDCDWRILLTDAAREESLALGRRFPAFQIVVTTGGGPVPPAQPERIAGSGGWLVEVGEKVKEVVVLGLYDDPQQPLRYQRVPLDSRFAPSAAIQSLLRDYQDELRQVGLEGLGLQPVPHPRRELQGDFVGSAACGECHAEALRTWQKSGHARATRTLIEAVPPRHFDPECIACHMTGWHPPGAFPYQSGYASLDSTAHLVGVGCESCHGPGGAHAAAEAGQDEIAQQRLRKALKLGQLQAKQLVCPSCHDVNNSPDFAFDAYWPDVAHYTTRGCQ